MKRIKLVRHAGNITRDMGVGSEYDVVAQFRKGDCDSVGLRCVHDTFSVVDDVGDDVNLWNKDVGYVYEVVA